MINPLSVKFLYATQSKKFVDEFDSITGRLLSDKAIIKYTNPSVIITSTGTKVFSVTGIAEHGKYNFPPPFVMYGNTVIDLSSDWDTEVYRLGDPKLFSRNSGRDVFVMYNCSTRGSFDLYVKKVYPEQESPKKITVDDQQAVEKNWGLFEQDGKLKGIYSLNPLVIIELDSESDTELKMKRVYSAGRFLDPDLSIGSMPVLLDDRYVGLVMHHKPRISRSARYYIPYPAKIDLKKNEFLVSTETAYPHSLGAMMGENKRKRNGVFACTYVSSLSVIGDEMVWAYGVSDSYYGFAKLPMSIFDQNNFIKFVHAYPPEEPTKVEQAKNATKAVATAAKSIVKTSVLRKGRVSDDLYKKRLNTCTNCPGNHAVFKNGALHTCGQFKDSITGKLPTCGCVLTKKARDESQNCPMGYWANLTIEGK